MTWARFWRWLFPRHGAETFRQAVRRLDPVGETAVIAEELTKRNPILEDVGPLEHALRHGRAPMGLPPASWRTLTDYDGPGCRVCRSAGARQCRTCRSRVLR